MRFLNSQPSPEARFLTLALRGAQPGPAPELAQCAQEIRDWHEVARLVEAHRVGPWLCQSLSDRTSSSLVPQATTGEMRTRARQDTLRTMWLTRVLEDAVSALDSKGIPAIVLKGPAVAERYYPDPGLRPYRDVDLLVPLEAHRDVANICSELGYVLTEDHGGVDAVLSGTPESPFEAQFVHLESGARLEIHYDHFQTGLRPQTLKDVWSRSEEFEFAGVSARALARDDLFLFLCVHLNKHGFLGLLWFKDLDLILRQEGDGIDWEWLSDSARKEGVLASVTYSLHLLGKLLATPLPDGAHELLSSARPGLIHRTLWRESEILDLRGGRWRRAVQFVPGDGVRGVIPSVLVMGRRAEKIKTIGRRLLGRRQGLA